MFDENEISGILTAHYPIKITKVEFFREGGSFSYTVYTDTDKFFLRVVGPAFKNTVLQSIDINLYLLRNNFPVPDIALTSDGETCFQTKKQDISYTFILYKYIEGNNPEPDEVIERAGIITADMHNIMQSYTGELHVLNKHYYIDRYIEILRKKQYPENKVNRFESYGNELWDRIKNLPVGFCHGDYHRGNFIKASDGKLYVLDFDTASISFPMYDIMMICNETDYFNFDKRGYGKSKDTLDRFLHDYLKYRTLTVAEINSFFDLIAVYHFQLQANIIEIFGLDCVDEAYLDKQLDWMERWRDLCESKNII